MEKEESSSLEVLRELGRELGRDPWRLETDEFRTGRGAEVTALAMAVMEAGSCSGGDAFHLSKGLRSATSELSFR